MSYGGENLALHLPTALSEGLTNPSSVDAAADMPVSQWSSCLRNALAHAGIADQLAT
jgi:hypothetical protein